MDFDQLAGSNKKVNMMSTGDAAKQISPFDIACLCIAALCAYVVGKGSGAPSSVEHSEQQNEESTEETAEQSSEDLADAET